MKSAGTGSLASNIPIRGRGLQELRADDGALARTVLDDHGLAEPLAKRLGDRARARRRR